MGGEEETLGEGVSVDREELEDAASSVPGHENHEGRTRPLEERSRPEIMEKA